MAPERRVATLLAFARAFEIIAMDDAIDLLDFLISQLIHEARNEGEKQRLRTLRDLDAAALPLRFAPRPMPAFPVSVCLKPVLRLKRWPGPQMAAVTRSWLTVIVGCGGSCPPCCAACRLGARKPAKRCLTPWIFCVASNPNATLTCGRRRWTWCQGPGGVL